MRTVKGSDSIAGNGEENGEGSDHIPVMLNIKVSHRDNGCEVAVPSDSSFGHLKSVAGQKMGLKPELLKLLFRGIEKADDDNLLTAGVKNNSKVSLIDDLSSEQKISEVKETGAISIGAAAVAEVREEVDQLAEKVSAVEVVVDSGTKVDEKDILYLTEMLMRQLLKLDGIEAEGEGKIQRKQEVRRVQGLVEKMDILKSKNSNAASDADNTESISTSGTVEPYSGSSSIPHSAAPSAPQSVPHSNSQPVPPSTSQTVPPSDPSPAPSLPSQAPPLDPSVAPLSNTSVAPPHSNLYLEVHSNPHVDLHSNHYPDSHSNHYPNPYSNLNSVPHPYPYSAPHSNLYSEPHASPYPMAHSAHYAYHPSLSYFPNYAQPHSAPHQMQYSAPPPLPYSGHYLGQYSSPSTAVHTPYSYPGPHSNPPYPPSAPHHHSYPAPHSDPHNVQSSNTKVTQNWEHFD